MAKAAINQDHRSTKRWAKIFAAHTLKGFQKLRLKTIQKHSRQRTGMLS